MWSPSNATILWNILLSHRINLDNFVAVGIDRMLLRGAYYFFIVNDLRGTILQERFLVFKVSLSQCILRYSITGFLKLSEYNFRGIMNVPFPNWDFSKSFSLLFVNRYSL